MNDEIKIIFQKETYRIKSYYSRRYLVQHYNLRTGHWYTNRVCYNDAEAREYIKRQGIE